MGGNTSTRISFPKMVAELSRKFMLTHTTMSQIYMVEEITPESLASLKRIHKKSNSFGDQFKKMIMETGVKAEVDAKKILTTVSNYDEGAKHQVAIVALCPGTKHAQYAFKLTLLDENLKQIELCVKGEDLKHLKISFQDNSGIIKLTRENIQVKLTMCSEHEKIENMETIENIRQTAMIEAKDIQCEKGLYPICTDAEVFGLQVQKFNTQKEEALHAIRLQREVGAKSAAKKIMLPNKRAKPVSTKHVGLPRPNMQMGLKTAKTEQPKEKVSASHSPEFMKKQAKMEKKRTQRENDERKKQMEEIEQRKKQIDDERAVLAQKLDDHVEAVGGISEVDEKSSCVQQITKKDLELLSEFKDLNTKIDELKQQ